MVVYGKHIVELILLKYQYLIENIYLAKEVDKSFFGLLKKTKKQIIKLDAKKAQAMARGGNHQGYLLEIKPLEVLEFSKIKEMDFVLVLCGISDVGNLGSIFRSAYALGVDGIVVCGIKDFKQEGVLRASSGAMLGMPFCVVHNPLDVINELKQSDFTLFGTSMQSKDLQNALSGKKALFLGSEGYGLSNKILAKMDYNLTIPMKREFDSLNVGVAGAILIDRMTNGRN